MSWTAFVGVILALFFLILFVWQDTIRKRLYLRRLGVSVVNERRKRELRTVGETAPGLIDDIRVMYPPRDPSHRTVDLRLIFSDDSSHEDTEAEPVATFLLYEFDIQEDGQPRVVRGATHFGGAPHEAVARVGDQVTVRYLPQDPTVSMIECLGEPRE